MVVKPEGYRCLTGLCICHRGALDRTCITMLTTIGLWKIERQSGSFRLLFLCTCLQMTIGNTKLPCSVPYRMDVLLIIFEKQENR